ncbi:MAG: exodeoxyribonuclease VII large subunit [Opitutales bacterium]|nr:exodeoxyribonuclease VII large subunit [Opitutales bacterium]MCH8540484.1 exodeoxyribonuclease VII large subunit [Opitutales bacterium]
MAYSSPKWHLQEADAEEIFTVTELNRRIKALLEGEFPPVWIRGEISNFRRQHSGHAYFTLKDDGGQISAVLFRGNAKQVNIDLHDGQEILALGEISVYEPRGTCQIIVRHAIESGEGQLQAEYERLKKQLAQEGLFAREIKKPLPALPRHIGLITSASGAAAKDFLRILKRRQWKGKVTLLPVLVQGRGAAPDIAETLDWANKSGRFDLLVVTRGGGSLEDLWAFNEEQTVRAIAASYLPVISAVGHEIDTTLADLAADHRAETPSGAAETISSLFLEWQNSVVDAGNRLAEQMRYRQESLRATLETFRLQLRNHSPEQKIENASLRLDDLQNRMERSLQEHLTINRQTLRQNFHKLSQQNPESYLSFEKRRLPDLQQTLQRLVYYRLEKKSDQLREKGSTLKSMDIQQILRRGFSIVTDAEGKILTRAKALSPGQLVNLRLPDGQAVAEIKELAEVKPFPENE